MPEPITARRIVQSKLDGKCNVDTLATANDNEIPFNESPSKLCWRLVHDGKAVLNLFESDGITWTKNKLFCGTRDECEKEIDALSLKRLPEEPSEPTP